MHPRQKQLCQFIERAANISVERNHSHSWPVTPYQTEGVELAAKVAADLGLSSKQVMTLAGHDSINMKDLVPTVMLFVPSVDGISLNEHEYTTDDDIVAGLAMLTEVVNRLCNGVLEDEGSSRLSLSARGPHWSRRLPHDQLHGVQHQGFGRCVNAANPCDEFLHAPGAERFKVHVHS